MAPVVRLVVVLVAEAVCPREERPHELPGQRPFEVDGIQAHVEVAPDHQPGDVAADEEHAAGGREPLLNFMSRQEILRFSVELLLARQQL